VDQEQDAVLQEVFTTDEQPFVPDDDNDDNECCDHVEKEQTDVATLTETMTRVPQSCIPCTATWNSLRLEHGVYKQKHRDMDVNIPIQSPGKPFQTL